MGWTHFEYTSGANPYIATRDWRRKEILRKCSRLGYGVRKVGDNHYIIYDKEGEQK